MQFSSPAKKILPLGGVAKSNTRNKCTEQTYKCSELGFGPEIL